MYYIAYNFSYSAIYLPVPKLLFFKLLKFYEVLTDVILHSCILYSRPILQGYKMFCFNYRGMSVVLPTRL